MAKICFHTSIGISNEYIPRGSTNEKSAPTQAMVGCRLGNSPSSELVMTSINGAHKAESGLKYFQLHIFKYDDCVKA